MALWTSILWLESISFFKYLSSVYRAWTYIGYRMILLPFNTQHITPLTIVFVISERLPHTFLATCSPIPITGCLLANLSLLLTFGILAAYFFKTLSTHSHWINSAFSEFTNSSQCSNLATQSASTVSQCWGPSWRCFKQFCLQILDCCFVSRNSATHTFIHLFNSL